MSQRFDSGYDPSKIRLVPWPDGEDCGSGWWRFSWVIMTEPDDPPTQLRLSSPSPELGDLSLIVAIITHEAGRVDLDVLSKGPRLAWNEIAYISLVVQAIGALYRQITVDGHADHPLLHISKT